MYSVNFNFLSKFVNLFISLILSQKLISLLFSSSIEKLNTFSTFIFKDLDLNSFSSFNINSPFFISFSIWLFRSNFTSSFFPCFFLLFDSFSGILSIFSKFSSCFISSDFSSFDLSISYISSFLVEYAYDPIKN